jgi:hypothetical protein
LIGLEIDRGVSLEYLEAGRKVVMGSDLLERENNVIQFF